MTRRPSSASPTGRGAPLPPLIHGRVRLLLLSYLMKAERPAAFTELRDVLGLTDGTLSVHLSRLEEGGMVTVRKRFAGRRPQTLVSMTEAGRRRFRDYADQLKRIVPGL